tara:strand:+ start:14426 stop:16804 length:2379 start_codon:yes stop_codon:yes gene_type:complete
MEQQETGLEKIQVPRYAKIKVYWSDYPENYSRESRTRVKKYFANKYGIDSQSINVVYKPIKRNTSGDIVEIDGANIENIMSTHYQRELFKEWLTREGKEDVDFNRILLLDDKVNSELDVNTDQEIHKKYKIKWITVNNFLSYGENNYFPVDRFKGFTVVNSNPSNQGGKTSITIDAIKFLFFGKTTKTDTNAEVFNQFSKGNELIVRGLIEIEDSEEIIIERKLDRKPKRKGGWNISNKIKYYKILPDGDEEELNDEDVIKTTKLIKDTVGSESDFDLVVLATSRNLDNLVDSTAGESGRLLTRFIGLEPIALKEKASREMYNTFSKSMKGNIYDTETLKEEITKHNEELVSLNKLKEVTESSLAIEVETYKKLSQNKLDKVISKDKIDDKILSMNPSKLNDEIKTITEKGIKHKNDIDKIKIELKKIGEIDFDEDKDFNLTKDKEKLTKVINLGEAEVIRLKSIIKNLISSGICQACNRKLDDVDNTEHIKQHNIEIDEQNKIIESSKVKLETVNSELLKLSNTKKLIETKNSLELKRDRLSVDIDSLRNEIKDKKLDLKKYKDNLESIEKNKNIDIDISLINTKINVSETAKNNLNAELQTISINIGANTNEVLKKENLIKVLKQEKDIERIYKLYIDMVGKKGISKLVLRSVLPIINGELQRLLEDITDFDVEVFIDDKNEVRYLLVKDGVEKALKSGSGFELTTASIALRCVLGKMSSLPTPNFITFDEVMGRVAPVNIPNMKPLFERISDMFDIVFFITQNEIVKDWADNIISIEKVNNISKLSIKE